MIARMWRGSTRAEDARAYAEYMGGIGAQALADTPGNPRRVHAATRRGDAGGVRDAVAVESGDTIRRSPATTSRWPCFFPDDDR